MQINQAINRAQYESRNGNERHVLKVYDDFIVCNEVEVNHPQYYGFPVMKSFYNMDVFNN